MRERDREREREREKEREREGRREIESIATIRCELRFVRDDLTRLCFAMIRSEVCLSAMKR